MPSPIFEDEHFLDSLVALLTRDPESLRSCAALLTAKDFQPLRGMKFGYARWVVAERALRFYEKHREPAGRLLRSDVLEYARQLNLVGRRVEELKGYLDSLDGMKITAPAAVTESVGAYKRERLKAQAIQELTDLHSAGMLTDEKWYEICQKAVDTAKGTSVVSDYLTGLSARNERRKFGARHQRNPWTFIDPLDSMIKCIGPKHLGLVLAPYKRGKSLFMLWLAVAYVFQRLNVLYITLEDPLSDVEDRLDSLISNIPLTRLGEFPQTLEKRFQQWKRLVHARLKIVDGTGGGVSIPVVEKIFLEERAHGFNADAVFVDYDDEIVAVVKNKDRRFEFADIYRDYAQFLRRYNLIGWTGAQAQRDTEHLKILSGDRVAEDISKMRKVTQCISLGKGDWGTDGIYLYAAANRIGPQRLGCNIVPDLDRSLIYSREATAQAALEHGV